MFSDLRKKFVFLTMSILIVVVLFLFAVSNRYNQYWDEYDAYRIVKLVAKNDYLGIPGDEPIALVTIDNQKMVKIQSNNTDLTNDVIEKSSLKLLEQGKKRSPTQQRISVAAAASVHGLAPLHLPRRPTRPVSYYAFFK